MEKVKFTKTVFFAYPPVLATCDGKKLCKYCRPHKYEQKSTTIIFIIPPEAWKNAYFRNI